jgi:hypothetical protein
MKHSVQHDLSPELAKKVLDKAIESYKERFADYSPSMTWVGDKHIDVKFKAKGIAIAGAIDLEPTQITFDLDVPFLLRPFKSQALEIIEGQIRKWTDKAKKGEIS